MSSGLAKTIATMWLIKTCVWGFRFVVFEAGIKSKQTQYERVRAGIRQGFYRVWNV
jgi:hypothetical protein